MPLKNMLANIAFDAATADILTEAFESAWGDLTAKGDPTATESRREATRRFLALRIIELAHQGERDVTRLRDNALNRLRASDQNR